MQKKILMSSDDERFFDEIFELFVVSKTASGVSDATLRNYHYHMKSIERFLDTKRPMNEITKRDVERIVVEMKKAGMLMKEIRGSENNKKELIEDLMIESYEIDQGYIKQLLAGNPLLSYDDAVGFYKVLVVFSLKGKQAALDRFDKFVDAVVTRNSQNAMFIIPYLCGALYPNGIVSQSESNELSKKYVDKILGF